MCRKIIVKELEMKTRFLYSNEEKLRKNIASFLCSAQNEVTINISKLNFIDASRTVLINSAKCWAQNPFKKINWIVKNENIRSSIMPFKLNNTEIFTGQF